MSSTKNENEGNAHYDRRISSSYAISRDDISPEIIGETIQDCLAAIRSISSIDVTSIRVDIKSSSVVDTVMVTVEANEGTGADYSLDKVAMPPRA